jgi:hypothetical protein
MFLLLLLCFPFLTAFFYNGNNIRNNIRTSVSTQHTWNMYLKDYDNTPFLNLLNYNLEITKKLNFTPVSIDEKFMTEKTDNGFGILRNYCFQSKEFRKVRFTYLDMKSKVQYFGLVLHPDYHYDVPILNFELISYNNEKIVYIMNMVKMDNTKTYNDQYVVPFIDAKKKYPELKENLAIKMSNYSIFGNYISEAILLGNFVQKNKDLDKIENIYNNIVFPSFEDFIGIYFGLFENATFLNNDDLVNIKNRHKLFDMKKAFVESRYDIRKYFDDKWYMSMLYDFFYDLKMDDEDDV